MRLAGITSEEYFSMGELEKTFFENKILNNKLVVLSSINTIVTAIAEAAAGKDNKDTRDKFNQLKAHLFPELSYDTEEKAAKTQELLKREFEGGPLKVQTLAYSKKKKKKAP